MTLNDFVRKHREELNDFIAKQTPGVRKDRLTAEERRLWVQNDEGLYRWAQSEGVPV